MEDRAAIGVSVRAGVEALVKYWRRVGLVPIDGHPEILGQATAYSHLSQARAALSGVEYVEIAVPTSQIVEEQPDAYPRHTVVDESEPRPQVAGVARLTPCCCGSTGVRVRF